MYKKKALTFFLRRYIFYIMQPEKKTATGDDDVRSSMYVRNENSHQVVIVNQQQEEFCNSCGCVFSWIIFVSGLFFIVPWVFGPFFFFSRDRGAKIGAIASSVALGICVIITLITVLVLHFQQQGN